jgi:hypothetical protein
MHLVFIAWAYVVLMMVLVEALAPNGTVLGALFTLFLYGVLPLAVVLYILATPARRRSRAASAADPHRGAEPAGDTVAAERKEP